MRNTRKARIINGAALMARPHAGKRPASRSTPPPIAADPWSRAVDVMPTSFTGVFAVGISLIAIVIGGTMFTMDESGSSTKRAGGLAFGSGLMLLPSSSGTESSK